MENAIQVKNLSKSYGDFCLDSISFELPKGTILGLIGENGAGKSTLISAIVGNVSSCYDQLNILGKEFVNHEKEIKEKIGVIFDTAYYNEDFTPIFISKILKNVYKNFDLVMYKDYLQRFGLPEKKKLKTFSKGMKMKLQFACVLSYKPELLILDEATNGLDPLFRNEILEVLRDFTEDETHSVLMSSHITSDLDKIADYIAYLHEGKLAFILSNDELQNSYGIIHCKENFFQQLNPQDIVFYKKEDYYYSVLIKNKYEIKKVFYDIDIHPASIEDVMIFYAKGQKV